MPISGNLWCCISPVNVDSHAARRVQGVTGKPAITSVNGAQLVRSIVRWIFCRNAQINDGTQPLFRELVAVGRQSVFLVGVVDIVSESRVLCTKPNTKGNGQVQICRFEYI